MELIKKTNIDFLGLRYIFFTISGGLILLGILSMIFRGVKWGIDFSGGNLVQIKFAQSIAVEQVRKILQENIPEKVDLQTFPKDNSFVIRFKKTDASGQELGDKMIGIFKKLAPENNVELERTEYVGPAIGRYLIKQAYWAIIFSFLGIVVYVAFRFHSGVWGIAGVIALAHDVFITFGVFSLLGKEITISIIAALLTLAGYSINDTIVIFDRVRENQRLLRKEPLPVIFNRSINETLSRTIITSGTVLLVLSALFFFGGEIIHDFSFALLFGCTVGVYSTVAIALPIVYQWQFRHK